VGGLGTAVAEAIAEAALARPFARMGIPDVFGEGGASGAYLFRAYGLGVHDALQHVSRLLQLDAASSAQLLAAAANHRFAEIGSYSPV
jgi:transketolase